MNPDDSAPVTGVKASISPARHDSGSISKKKSVSEERSATDRVWPPGLPIRHEERIARKELALSVGPGTRWSKVESRIHALRISIRTRVASFVSAAEDAYNQTHRRRNGLR